LAFHAYVHNPEQRELRFVLYLHGPGLPDIQNEGQLPNVPGVVGHNFNAVFGVVPIDRSGEFIARLALEANPPLERPVEKEVRLELVLLPPA